jgi:DNA-binding response OmpR family regulator
VALELLLEKNGFDTRTALDEAEAFLPDVTVLDIGLPQMN